MVLLVLKVFKNIFKLGIKCKYYILFEIIFIVMFCFWLNIRSVYVKLCWYVKGVVWKKLVRKKREVFFVVVFVLCFN